MISKVIYTVHKVVLRDTLDNILYSILLRRPSLFLTGLTVSRKTRYIRRSLRRIQRWTCKIITAFLTCEKKCGLLSILVRYFVVLGIGMQNRI